jgi:hypothetical protein
MAKAHIAFGKVSLKGSMHMKFSMTGTVKGDLLIEVTTWAGLTVKVKTGFSHLLSL